MRTTYKLGKNNQLAITKGKIILWPHGNFILDDASRLVYKIKESQGWRRQYNIPQYIILDGKWAIDKNHNFIYTLRKTQTQAGNESLVLKSELSQVKANSLVFYLGTQGKEGTHAFRFLQLKGKWQADKYNRLQFLVKRLRSTSDVLTFQGSWQVKNNNLIYTYQKTSLKTKIKESHSLRFQGYWQISKKNQLTYILDAKSDSFFVFKTYLETPNIIGKEGTIKYRVGIGVRGDRLFRAETITLYGVWKFNRKTGLSFDVDYGDGKIKSINFGAFVRFDNSAKVTFNLKSIKGEALGFSVEFSRAFLDNNVKWFLRAIKENKHPRFEWGVTVPW